MRNWLARAFRCDLRSLAALRIALGLLVLADLALRLPWLAVYHTDAGAWPRAAAWADARGLWSLHFLGGSTEFAAGMLALSAAAAFALLLGWRTRVATAVSWLLLLSLHHRNGLILNGGDRMLALLLLWGMFLPLGARWSLDARRTHAPAGSAASVATAALLVQVALIYIFNALYKTGDPWQKDGTAIAEALQLETYATSLGHHLLGFPGLLHSSTRVIWWLELLGPLMAFLPWRNGTARLLAAGIFMSFHAALFCTLRLGLFPLVGIAAWLPFLPGGFWDFFRRQKHGEPAPRPIALEGIAGGCLTIVILWNLCEFYKVKLPPFARIAVLTLGLEQRWSLFAPAPPRTEGWLVAVLECADGNEYDALTGAEVDWTRPANLSDRLGSANWRLFLRGVRDPQHPQRIHWLADWLVRKWERQAPEKRVQRIRIHYLWEWLAARQSPPDNWLVYENPPGPLTAQLQLRAPAPRPPLEASEN